MRVGSNEEIYPKSGHNHKICHLTFVWKDKYKIFYQQKPVCQKCRRMYYVSDQYCCSEYPFTNDKPAISNTGIQGEKMQIAFSTKGARFVFFVVDPKRVETFICKLLKENGSLSLWQDAFDYFRIDGLCSVCSSNHSSKRPIFLSTM